LRIIEGPRAEAVRQVSYMHAAAAPGRVSLNEGCHGVFIRFTGIGALNHLGLQVSLKNKTVLPEISGGMSKKEGLPWPEPF
jgi:hypothetical protein